MYYYQDLLTYSKDLNVLFIEDDKSFREETVELLKMFFKRVDAYDNARDALEQYKEFYFHTDSYYDLIISDVNLPKMSGEQFAKEIKVINKAQPITIISAFSDPLVLINFIKLGIDDFLIKPFNSEELQASLYKVSKRIYENKEKNSNGSETDIQDILCSDDSAISFDFIHKS